MRLHVVPEDHIQKDIFWYGFYDKEVTLTFLSFIEPETVFLDIGANIGYFTLFAAQKATNGHVYAFEPVTHTRKLLNDNIQLNGIKNISVLPYCVSNRTGERKIYISSKENIGMSGLAPAENFSGDTENAEAIVIDDWLEKNPSIAPGIIKIDVEGAEPEVLEGMTQTLKKFKPVIFIEVIEEQLAGFGCSAKDIFQFFEQQGYIPYEITGENQLKRMTTAKDSYNIVFLHRDKNVNDPALKII